MNHKRKSIEKTNGDAKIVESDSKVDTGSTASDVSGQSSQQQETNQGLWRYIDGGRYLLPSWSLVDAFLIATHPKMKKGMRAAIPLLREDGSVQEVEVAITNTVMMRCIQWKNYESRVLSERDKILNSEDKEVSGDERGKG